MKIKAALPVLLALALTLTACQESAPTGSGSFETEEPDVAVTGNVDLLESDPDLEEAVQETLAPQPRLTQEDVDQALEEVMSRYSAAAVSVAAIEGGQVTQSGAWGWAVKDQREMTAGTKVRVASLSKVAVGMCAMAMAEDGLLDLEAPLSDYWGGGVENPTSKTQPSARTLMTHTSSLRDLEITRGLSTLRGLLQSRSSWRNMEPGDGGYWYYSNFGFCILGTTLELAADQLLDNYFQSRFLQPLGARASLHAGNLEAEEVACLYNASGGVERSPQQQTGQKVPDQIGLGASYFPGGMTISAVDLAKLTAVLAGDGMYDGVQYLTPESVAAMEEPQFTVTPTEGTPFQQCLVLRRQEDILGQSVLYYHTGSSYGVYSLLSYNPETGNGVVVITTGAKRQTDEYGLYALCADLSADLYARMEGAV